MLLLAGDDALVTKFSITTDQLLETVDVSHVHLVIDVTLKATERTWANLWV